VIIDPFSDDVGVAEPCFTFERARTQIEDCFTRLAARAWQVTPASERSFLVRRECRPRFGGAGQTHLINPGSPTGNNRSPITRG
jgi:hypothetical protein